MIVGVCGFSWSGSSAVSDYLSEFAENQIYDRKEFLLSFFPDGLQDLDYNLNTNCSKITSCCVAIPRFKKTVNYLFGKVTNGKINDLTDKYLDNIVQAKWVGSVQGQVVLHNTFLYHSIGRHILNLMPKSFCEKTRMYPLEDMYLSINPDQFLYHTQNFTDSILSCLGLDLDKNIILDQPFAGNSPERGMKYFRNSRAIVVDRDPRDIYILGKKYFKNRFYGMPMNNIDDFCEYFKRSRYGSHSYQTPNVLYVKFEDLIYEYDKTSKAIRDFLGLTKPLYPLSRFNPKESMVNTRLFFGESEYYDEIKVIENKLNEYLFDFEQYPAIMHDRNRKVFDEKTPVSLNRH